MTKGDSIFKERRHTKEKEPDLLDKIAEIVTPHIRMLKNVIRTPLIYFNDLAWLVSVALTFLNMIEMMYQLELLFLFALSNLYFLLAYRKIKKRLEIYE